MIRELFVKYQKELIRFCNTEYGKWFLQDRFGGKIEKSDKVVKVTPDGFHLLKDFKNNRPLIEATFFPRSPYIKKFANILLGLDLLYSSKKYIPKYKDWNEFGFKNLYLATNTYNPDAHPESTSVDGMVDGGDGSNQTWSGIHDRSTGLSATDTSGANTQGPQLNSTGTTNMWGRMKRTFYLYDTSSLTSNAIIESATHQIYVNSIEADNFSQNLCLVTTSPASNTAITTSDYSQVGTTQQASDLAVSSLSANAYNTHTLNSTGLSNISKTGVTKFGQTFSADRTNTAPTWVANKYSLITVTQSDAGSNKPKLVVVYSLPAGGGFLYNFV